MAPVDVPGQADAPVGSRVHAAAAARGLSAESAAAELGLNLEAYLQLLNGGLMLTADLAERLTQVLGLVVSWDREQAADDQARWVESVPDYSKPALAELRRRGFVKATKSSPDRLAGQLLAFFECGPAESMALVKAAYRQSAAHPVDPAAVAVWLRLADQQARRVLLSDELPELDLEALRELASTLIQVGTQEPETYLPEVVRALGDVGVVLVFEADVPGTRLSGASWPTENHAVVALTLRGRQDDRFWWTLYHELAHVLLGHGRVVESDGAEESEREQEADSLARELLLPPDWKSALGEPLGRPAVLQCAARLNVPPGVLVGQLHHDGLMPKSWLNDLRQSTPSPAELSGPHLRDVLDARTADLQRFRGLLEPQQNGA